ncbi:unnamed protein product, partial [marine sediment metagenome]
ATEQELKKKKDESVGVTLDAKAMLDDVAFERDNARTGAARRAAQKQLGGRMNRKILSILGMGLLIFTFYGCSSNPEQGLLDRYFNALSLDDVNTLSTMALEPVDFK